MIHHRRDLKIQIPDHFPMTVSTGYVFLNKFLYRIPNERKKDRQDPLEYWEIWICHYSNASSAVYPHSIYLQTRDSQTKGVGKT
jgi:hypothetical protein